MHREHEDARLWIEAPDMLYRVDTATARHGNVHHDDVGPWPCMAIRRRGIGRFADHAQTFVLLQKRPVALANHGVIVDEEDVDRLPVHWTLAAAR